MRQGRRPSVAKAVAAAICILTLMALAGVVAMPSRAQDPLRIWWAAPLYPLPDNATYEQIQGLAAQYEREHGSTFTIRLKASEGAGGIYAALSSAAKVAPAAVPDLVLVRRADLLRLANAQIVVAFTLSPDFDTDVYPAALALGSYNGRQWGVPFVVELQQAVYRPSAFNEDLLTPASLLKYAQPYVFPSANGRSIMRTVLAQYVAAGGLVRGVDATPVLSREALVAVLTYYEALVQANLFDGAWLDTPDGGSVLDQLASDQINAAQIDAADYLRLLTSNQTRWKAASIPSVTSTPPVVIDGWLWAITTTNEARRTEALAVIDWLSENQRLGQYARAMNIVPLRPSALQVAYPQAIAREYLDLVGRILNAPTILPDQVDPLVLGALQGAFEDVINRRRSATDAAEIALALVNKP